MGFGFNLSGKKSKSKTTSSSTGTFTNTTTPTVPDWAAQPVQTTAGRINAIAGMDPAGFVAPAHGLQTQAAAGAAGLGAARTTPAAAGTPQSASDTDWLSPYMTADTPFASGGKAYDWMGRYMNPYLDQVVTATSADLDAHEGRVRAQQDLDLAGAGAFGGSGAALTRSATEGELSRARASTLSGLRSQAFQTALTAAAGDADRATQARIANAQMALQDRAQKVSFGLAGQQQTLAADANARENISTQSKVGETMRGIDQQQRQAPVTSAEQVVAMLNNLPIGLFTGKTESGVKSDTSTSTTKGTDLEAGISYKS